MDSKMPKEKQIRGMYEKDVDFLFTGCSDSLEDLDSIQNKSYQALYLAQNNINTI